MIDRETVVSRLVQFSCSDLNEERKVRETRENRGKQLPRCVSVCELCKIFYHCHCAFCEVNKIIKLVHVLLTGTLGGKATHDCMHVHIIFQKLTYAVNSLTSRE